MQTLDERGYIIPAFDTETTSYIKCAVRLASSIKAWHPDAKICLLTDKEYTNEIFDYVKILPFGSAQNKQENDWQVFRATPFRQTIKLEADMVAASPVDHYWTLFEKRDVVISLGARDFYGNLTDCRKYRKIFDKNNLPDVYNAITYWRMSHTAMEFFNNVKLIFENWEEVRKVLQNPDEYPTTDVVYAIATMLMGAENVTLPNHISPTIVHMKKDIIPIRTNDWTKELIWEKVGNGLRIGTIDQWGFVHYHVKEWVSE